MSHPLYHTYACGKQSSSQGSYGLSSSQTERNPQEASCFLGPGSSVSSSRASTGNSWPMNQLSLQRNYIPEQSRSVLGEGIESSVDMHIRRIREEVRLVGSSVNQPMDQDTCFSSIQRDEFSSSGTAVDSYPKSSTSFSFGQRQNFDLSSNCSRQTNDFSKINMPHAFSNFTCRDDSKYGTPNERRDIKSIPGFKDHVVHSSVVPNSGLPRYNSESATNILMHFGLEKDDLEQLIAYPADQMTPSNLPFILQQILLQKDKRATTIKSKTLLEPQSSRPVSGINSCNLTRISGALMQQGSTCSAGFQSSNMIDYDYTGKYPVGLGAKIGGKCDLENDGMIGNVLSMDSAASRHILESLQQNTAEFESSALGPLSEKTNSFTSPSSLCSSAPKSFQGSDQTEQLPTQPNQALQYILSSFPLLKKDAQIGHLNSEASKPTPLKEVDQSVLKTQQPSTQPRSMHPSAPGLLNIGSNKASGTKDSSKSKRSVVVEHIFRQQGKEKQQMQQIQQTQNQKSREQTHKQKKTWQTSEQRLQQMQVQQAVKEEMQPATHTGQTMWPPVSSAQTLVPPVPLYSRPIFSPPVLPQPPIDLTNFNHLALLTSVTQSSAKVAVPKDQPTQAMVNDYASTTTPRLFPHTCSLCNKKCKNIQAWITHHSSILHFDNCKKLRQKYPEWAAELDLESRDAAQDAKASLSTSAQSSRHKRTRYDSRSRSKSESPRHHQGSKCGRDERHSRSRSPRRSRYHHRSPSWSRSRSRSLSCSRSCSFSRSRSRSRSHSRSRSPWYDPWISSRYRSYSRSPDRWSSPRGRDRQPSTPRRNCERRTPARRKRKRRSPTDLESSPERDRKKRARRLAKKLLKTSGVQSLPNQSDLEAVVKTLAPALVAALSKIKSSSSVSGKSQKRSSSQSGGGTRSSSNASSSPSTARKEFAAKTAKKKPSLKTSESDQSSSPAAVRLHGIHNTLTHSELLSAVEQFGKIKSVVMFWAKMEAEVVFENAEGAKKLRYLKYLYIDGIPLTVINGQDAVSKEEKKASQKKSVMSSASTTESINEKAQPHSAAMYKCLTTDTKEKVVMLEAQNVSSQLNAKTLPKGKLSAKGAVVKQKISSTFKAGTQPNAVDSKGRSGSELSQTAVKIPVGGMMEKPKVTGPVKGTVVKAKVSGSKAEKVSTVQKQQTPVTKLSAQKTATEENVGETAEKDQHESIVPEQQPIVENVKPKEWEKAHIPVKSKDTANVEEVVAAHAPVVKGSEDKNVSYKLTAKTLKTRILAGKRATETTMALQETKSSSSENKSADSNQPVPKKSTSTDKDPVVALKEKPKAEEPEKGKVFNSKAENFSINQKPQPLVVKPPIQDAPAEGNVEKTKVKDQSESAKTTTPYCQSNVENLKPKKSEKETKNNDHASADEADDGMVTGFERKKLSDQLTAQALKTEVLAADGASEGLVFQKTSSGSLSGFPENQPDAVGSNQLPILETSVTTNEESIVELQVKSKAEEPAKGTTLTAKVSDSKAETFPILQKPQTPVKKLPVQGALTEENIQETAAESETKAQESLKLLEETPKPVDKVNASAEKKDKTKVEKSDVTDASMLMLSGVTRATSKQTVKTLKSGTLPKKGVTVKVVAKQKTSSSKSGSPENQPTAVGSRESVSKKPEPTKESMLELKNKPKALDQSKSTVITAKMLDSKNKIVSTIQPPQITVHEPPVQKVPTGENVQERNANGPSEPTKSTALCCQPDVENLKPKVSETNVQNFMVLRENTKADVPGENKEVPKDEEAVDGDELELGASEVKHVSSQQIRSITEHQTMAIKRAAPKGGLGQKTAFPDSKQRQIPEKSKTPGKEPVAELKNKPEAAKQVKVVEAKVLNSKAETVSIKQKPQSSVNELPAQAAAAKVNVQQETITKDMSKATNSTASYHQPGVEKPRHKENETQVQESLELLKDTVKASKVNVQESKGSDLSQPISTASMNQTDLHNPEPKEPEFTGQESLAMLGDSREAVEKVNASAENEDQVKVKHADEEPMDLVLSEVKVVEPGDTSIFKGKGNSTNSDILRESQTPAKDAYKASENASTVESVPLTTQLTAAAVSEQQPPSMVVQPLTVGEMVDKLLDPSKIECFDIKRCFKQKASVAVISVALEVVVSVAPVINLLPLANMICIEMVDPSCATKVLARKNELCPNTVRMVAPWRKVRHSESVKTLKQHLLDSGVTPINLEQANECNDGKPVDMESQVQVFMSEPSDGKYQAALQTSSPDAATISEPISLSGTSQGSRKEDDEKSGVCKSLKQSIHGSRETQIKFEQATFSSDSKPRTVESQSQHPLSEPHEDGTKPNLQTSRPHGSTISDSVIAGPRDEAKTEEGEKQGTVKAPKQSLQDSRETAIKPEQSTISVDRKSTAVETQTQCCFLDSSDNRSICVLKTSYPDGLIISEPISAGSVSSSIEVKMEDVEKINVKSVKLGPINSENAVKPEHTTASVDAKTPKSQTHNPASELWSQSTLQTSVPDQLTISKLIAPGQSSSGTSREVINESVDVKGLKQSLHGSGEMQVISKDTTFSADSKAPAVESQACGPPSKPFKNGSQFAVQPGESTTSDPIYTGQSSSSKSEKPGNEGPLESTPGSKSEEQFKKLIAEQEMRLLPASVSITHSLAECGGRIAPAASSPYSSSASCVPEEDLEEYPQIDIEILQALTVAIRQHRLTLAARSKEKAEKVRGDLENGVFADGNFPDVQNMKKDDFSTFDEVGDGKDPNSEPHHLSPSKCSSTESGERQSPGDEDTSTSSLKETKGQSSSSSLVSKSRILPNSTSNSPMKFEDLNNHSKPPPTTEVCSEMEIYGSFQGQEANKSVIEKTAFKIVDSVKKNKVQEEIKERFGTRSEKGDEVRTNPNEASEKPDRGNESTVDDKATVTIRSSGGLREIINVDAPVKAQTPLRKSRSRQETPKKKEKTFKKDSTTTKKIAGVKKELRKEVAICKILDSVEEEVLKDAPRGKGKKKRVKSANKGKARLKKGDNDMSQEAVYGEEVTDQILDFVKDKSVDDLQTLDQSASARRGIVSITIGTQEFYGQSLKGFTNIKEEEESKYQRADVVKDEQVQEERTATGESNIERKGEITKHKCLLKKAEQEEDIPVGTDALAVKNNGSRGQENISTTDTEAKRTSPFRSQSCPVRLETGSNGNLPKKEQAASMFMSPDDVRDEDYPDNTAEEEEEPRKQQAAAKEKQIAKKALQPSEILNQSSRDGNRKINDVKEEVEDSQYEDKSIKMEDVPSLVVLDEFVGKEAEGHTEVLPPRRRGKAKRIKQTPVRKSTRRKTVSTRERKEEGKEPADEQPASSSLDKETAEDEAASQVDIDVPFAVPQIRLESESLGGCAEDIGIKGKKWSQSYFKDFKLLKFKPNNPLGQEFVIPKSVFFCSLCSVFYINERMAKELHCSSRKHFNNLKKYHQKHQRKSSRSSKDSVSG